MEDTNNMSGNNEISKEKIVDNYGKKNVKSSVNSLKLISKSEKIIGLVILVAILVVVAWAFLGRLETVIEANGALSVSGGSIGIRVYNDALFSEIFVETGERIDDGETVATGFILEGNEDSEYFRDINNLQLYKAPFTGYITELIANRYDLVHRYDPIYRIIKYDGEQSYWVVYSVVSMDEAECIAPGMKADILVAGYPQETYGKITGVVESVSYTPEDVMDFTERIGNSFLASKMMDGENYVVQIKVDCNENGDPMFTGGIKDADCVPINSICDVTYHVKEGRPIDYIMGE